MNSFSAEAWLKDTAVQKIMQVLTSNGKEARFIGGCVRDALLRKPIHDIDIATQEQPEAVLKLLEDHTIKAIPTGIEHGTITAVCDGKVFEVTTLRSDIETDGRRARVAFTENWLEDAMRRDFTFNAMSMDIEGTLYDPFKGQDDLKAGHVRFVGNAEDRIREDYLRILRFFRFYAHYGKGRPDEEALRACSSLAQGIDNLSGERISQEFLRLLEAPRPAKTISLMIKAGVLPHILNKTQDTTFLEMMCAFEDQPDRIRRLAVLLPTNITDVEAVCARFKLSNAQKKRLIAARCAKEKLVPSIDHNQLRAFLYRNGPETAKDHVILYWAEKGFTGIGPKEQNLLNEIENWKENPAVFPLQGKDLLKKGYTKGPALGEALKQVEAWWCENGCVDDKEKCLDHLSLPDQL